MYGGGKHHTNYINPYINFVHCCVIPRLYSAAREEGAEEGEEERLLSVRCCEGTRKKRKRKEGGEGGERIIRWMNEAMTGVGTAHTQRWGSWNRGGL